MEPSPSQEPRQPTVYPDPFIVPPRSGIHNQTFILLHGGGLESKAFGEELLQTSIPDFHTLPLVFPDAKFIFPTATEQYAPTLGCMNRQFFHLHSTKDLDENDQVSFDGMHDSLIYIHGMIAAAIEEVGCQNVVVGGLSQGCAVTLISLLLWEGPPFAAAIGMAGWLPFRKRIEGSWSTDSSQHTSLSKLQSAVSCIREALNIPSECNASPLSCLEVPVFIGHGVEDDGLLLSLARPTHDCLIALGLNVKLRDYEGLGHWYSGEMLRNIVKFLQESRFGQSDV